MSRIYSIYPIFLWSSTIANIHIHNKPVLVVIAIAVDHLVTVMQSVSCKQQWLSLKATSSSRNQSINQFSLRCCRCRRCHRCRRYHCIIVFIVVTLIVINLSQPIYQSSFHNHDVFSTFSCSSSSKPCPSSSSLTFAQSVLPEAINRRHSAFYTLTNPTARHHTLVLELTIKLAKEIKA